ncbi:hypothetical protein BH24ACI2_BH24ACI2_04540 [soil metagenome]|nr:hypothetical protein [Acidobacteriota bacterium]
MELETNRKTQLPVSSVGTTSPKLRKFRSDASINRFLIKNKGYEFVDGKLEKRKMPTAKHSGIATRLTIKLGIF